MSAYYNEIEPYAAEWLRNLIKAGHIADGEVDTRSISDVQPVDLRGFTQGHFFAGIGVWSYALKLAGWPDDRPVWTGSCPCQPFSAAGKGAGFDDARHLWPVWYNLIRECRPTVVFGEQVASKDGLQWLDLVHADMEAADYAIGAFDLCAAGVGAPHIRQRLYFAAERVADAQQHGGGREAQPSNNRQPEADGPADQRGGHSSPSGCLADASCGGHGEHERNAGAVAGAGTCGKGKEPQSWGSSKAPRHSGEDGRPSPTNGFWGVADWLGCRDGKWRPVEPGTFPLAHGAPGRVGRLRAYGNAIVPQVAAEVIRAFL